MLTRNDVTSTRSESCAPSDARMSRIFSMTARVCTAMSSLAVPISSADAPAKVLSGCRELVPETNRKSPARRTCGKRPRGLALPGTIPDIVLPLSVALGGCRRGAGIELAFAHARDRHALEEARFAKRLLEHEAFDGVAVRQVDEKDAAQPRHAVVGQQRAAQEQDVLVRLEVGQMLVSDG